MGIGGAFWPSDEGISLLFQPVIGPSQRYPLSLPWRRLFGLLSHTSWNGPLHLLWLSPRT